MQEQLENLRNDAADCKSISDLAANLQKRELFARLAEAGFQVDTAGSATEAINKLRLVPGGVDAVVLDLGLPDKKGDELLREIRSLHRSLPVLLATGQGTAGLREHFKNEKAIAFVTKPYSAADLTAGLRKLGIRVTGSE
ncbi:DNA-binding response OmpR family regulator [Bradyrhizobium sp. GM24.11]